LDKEAVGGGEEEVGQGQDKMGRLPEAVSKQKLEGRKSWSFLYKCMTS
jgi:hypothetical protein